MDYKERAESELKELQEKTKKLGDFLLKADYSNVSDRQLELMIDQHDVMTHYVNILTLRLELM